MTELQGAIILQNFYAVLGPTAQMSRNINLVMALVLHLLWMGEYHIVLG